MQPRKNGKAGRILWILGLILLGIFGAIGGPVDQFEESETSKKQ